MASTDPAFLHWLSALEARHLANLRVQELTRALRALSSAYVERRHIVGAGRTLDSAGKRAAFALFYAPLHFLAVAHVVDALGLATQPPGTIIDLGCGTGVAGAAWALAAGGSPRVLGIDRHEWVVDEARWTFRQLGLQGQARRELVTRVPSVRAGDAVVAAYALNELEPQVRLGIENGLLKGSGDGGRVLVVEPLARGIAPWWEATAAKFLAAGGRADEWRIPVDLPPILHTLDRAAGLNHRELRLRTLVVGPGRR